ncbi:hypothetical protein BDN72DRAFT_856189 [Pluteus cervinus]|uniref:Uncharacterized protein n=1 Tax=Pluteus cervinus TaxID=181527 RepID=A0ACD3B0X1_9AGAR|nr:hypothetical protein BDN72DRAFT_856189 [Pluteus cervinus]
MEANRKKLNKFDDTTREYEMRDGDHFSPQGLNLLVAFRNSFKLRNRDPINRGWLQPNPFSSVLLGLSAERSSVVSSHRDLGVYALIGALDVRTFARPPDKAEVDKRKGVSPWLVVTSLKSQSRCIQEFALLNVLRLSRIAVEYTFMPAYPPVHESFVRWRWNQPISPFPTAAALEASTAILNPQTFGPRLVQLPSTERFLRERSLIRKSHSAEMGDGRVTTHSITKTITSLATYERDLQTP